VCTATGFTVATCRRGYYRPGVFTGCPSGSIINITSATLGSSTHFTYRHYRYRICTVNVNHVQCRTQTNSPEIMQCNGRRHCSLSDDAFNYPGNFTCQQQRAGNFIEITYNCITGKKTRSEIRFFLQFTLKNSIHYFTTFI